MNKAYSANNVALREKKVAMEVVKHENESYFRISDYDTMRPFFMSVVSDSNHWMFVSSNGGLTAGRKNPEYALFPYYTDDKLSEFAGITGSRSIFWIQKDGGDPIIWEPFSEHCIPGRSISRNLYKSVHGNKIMFEEINHDLNLVFRYQWSNSKKFGFIRKAALLNTSTHTYQISLVDGIQNIMPYGVPSYLQATTSNLVDAYKRSELETRSGIGIYALSAIIVDKAEPSEALKANIAWSTGIGNPQYLLSSRQLKSFRNGQPLKPEADVKGEKGAYFIFSDLSLAAESEKNWEIVANVNQTQADIIRLSNEIIGNSELLKTLQDDIDDGTECLIKLVGGADGLQCTSDQLNDTRHFSNVLFNIMRGGTFDYNYLIEKQDFLLYLGKANQDVVNNNQLIINQLPEVFQLNSLKTLLFSCEDVDFMRLGLEYLPLKFSRRHGDPSRPWNYFSINTQNETDGSKILDYEGNWRDLFQNWEALAHSYPDFISGMILKFMNATTFDGYNPYRVTKGGFDWETIEIDNPWSYIGYWGDHQIIYLQKFLEIAEHYAPGSLQEWFGKDVFVYAAVPYIIKPYEDILKNPKDTIGFDHKWDEAIRKKREKKGADGALLTTTGEKIYHVNFIEKILATVLAKLSNFIPGAGIWMNTQRPEWNDANNALVGNGVSMVTLNYLNRFLTFLDQLLDEPGESHFRVSEELADFYHSLRDTMLENKQLNTDDISDEDRKYLLDCFGKAASAYRHQIYVNGFSGNKRDISREGLKQFTSISISFIARSIRANQRPDKLFHAYNLITLKENSAEVSHLSEMLEGQVAVLSAGILSSMEALEVMNALKNSSLFRPDQFSYILYPNMELPGFLQKNNIPAELVTSSKLLQLLLANGDRTVVEKDVLGGYHFNGDFRNVRDLANAINRLPNSYSELVKNETTILLDIFEKVFNHKAFTGRSGTFYSYEGLGSIYWHMVSKLHLAVQECCLKAIDEQAEEGIVGKMLEHYYEIDAGIGVHKSPALYGAFPTDPYSHTPFHRGAQQPGMTGQVKEDILVHHGEMGVFVTNGQLLFNPCLLRKQAFLTEGQSFSYYTVEGNERQKKLEAGQLAFTICQCLVIYTLSDKNGMTVCFTDGTWVNFDDHQADTAVSNELFGRKGTIDRIEVYVNQNTLR
ncbi:MAG: hypothetical protein FD155_728 [Bacteroidetes bacterium]|nr:MAG: hypothetical protein FD155_728 [Bacteroidota bacterium]